jgi:small GTP-binding protein
MLQQDSNTIILSIWDIAGHGLFESVRKAYYEGGHGFLVVFDLNNRTSFDHVNNWLRELQETCPDAPVLILGNKADLPNWMVSLEEVTELCDHLGASGPVIVSAKTGEGVLDAFQQLSELMLEKI